MGSSTYVIGGTGSSSSEPSTTHAYMYILYNVLYMKASITLSKIYCQGHVTHVSMAKISQLL